MDDQNQDPQNPVSPTPTTSGSNSTLPITPDTASTPASAVTDSQPVQIGKYQVKVDRSLCIGAASCIAVSPNVFELDKESKATIKAGSTDTPENILLAAQSCPTKAIIVIDTETGKQVWPA